MYGFKAISGIKKKLNIIWMKFTGLFCFFTIVIL